MSWLRALITGLAALFFTVGGAAAETVRVGALKFGTVNWALEAMAANGFDAAEGIALEVTPLASKSATAVALQAGAVDIIVTDWLWAARERAAGADYVFAPYSTALGALVVPAGSKIEGLGDLKGARLGVAGGPLDKSWLLAQARAGAEGCYDLGRMVEPIYGAPPLLAEALRRGDLDAALMFWPYVARLEAAGFKVVARVDAIARALGADPAPPLVGYVFSERWAAANPELAQGFFKAVAATNAHLAHSNEAWERLAPLMKAESEAEFEALKAGFRAGIPKAWGEAERAAAGRLFEVLAEIGGPRLLGPARAFDPAVFWDGWRF